MRHHRESLPSVTLLQAAGNRAVASLLSGTGSLQRRPRKPRPLGWDVASVIAEHAPALLPHIPAEQIVAYQRWVDAVATNREIEGRWQAELGQYQAHFPDLAAQEATTGKLERGDVASPDTARRLRQIKAEKLPAAAEGPVMEVSAGDVLADDLKEGGGSPFHAADAALRAKWRDKLLAGPKLKVHVSDYQWWGVVLDWDGHYLYLEDGRIALSSLLKLNEFVEEYEREVRAPSVELRNAIDELAGYMSMCRDEHEARSDANEEHWYTGFIRHISEALGEGDEDYPTIKLWNEPQHLIELAQQAYEASHIDIAVMRYLRAHALGTAQAERYLRYENRVTSGAGVAVKWLERMKTAGTIAAGIASGGLGIAARVGIAGGYAFVREGAQQASGVAHGTRQSMDVGSMAKQATVEAAMALIGGKIEGSFQTALQARFGAKLAAKYGAGIAEQGISVAAAGASGFYTGPAQAVLESVITGNRPIPASLGELADIVADEAIQGAAMEAAIGPFVSKAGGHSTAPAGTPGAPGAPSAPPAPATTTPTASATTAAGAAGGASIAHSVAGPPGGAPPVKPHVFELAARAHQSHKATDALIDHFGSWEEAVAQIRAGTGDAAGISDVMRRNLLDTLKKRRDALVAELRTRFNAAPAGDTPSTEFGSDVDLNVAGKDAGLREIQARKFLDDTHPGWEKRFRMGLMVGSTRMGALGKAVAGLPPDLRAGVERHQVLATEAYNLARQARTAATDQERAELLGRIGDPELRKQAEAMVALDPADVPKERAKLLIESDRAREKAGDAASPTERAARLQEAMDVQMRANALDAEAYVSAGAIRGVVLGKRDLRPAERYQTVVDQVAMIQHAAAEAGGMRAALRRYETFKYIGRIVDQLRATGIKDPRLTFLENHAELVAKVDRAATSSAEARELRRDDLGQRAHEASVRADLGIVPGVSEQFLADVHEMLGGVLDQHLPALRANVLGEDGGTGGPPPVPVRLPALGPPMAATPGPGTGGSGPAAGVESGLTSPDALERIVSHSESAPDVTAGASLQDYAKKVAYAQLSSELTAIGTVPPDIEVRDLGDPNVEGHFDPKRNVIVVNEGAGAKGVRQFDASTPEGRRRLLRLLLHESRHAEQWFHALRHMARTKGAGWKDEAKAAGVNEQVILAAGARPLPPGQTPEGDLAARVYDEFLGSGKNITKLGQDTKRMAELREEIGKLETLRDLAASVLQRIPLHKLKLRQTQGDVVQRLSSKLSLVQADLEMRTEVYRSLEHEVDARKAEDLLERAFGRRELKAAEKRLEEAEAEVRRVRALIDSPDEARALEEAAEALEDYRVALLEVGGRLRAEPLVAGAR